MEDFLNGMAAPVMIGCFLPMMYFHLRTMFCMWQIKKLSWHLPYANHPGMTDLLFRKHILTPPVLKKRDEMFRYVRLELLCMGAFAAFALLAGLIHWLFV